MRSRFEHRVHLRSQRRGELGSTSVVSSNPGGRVTGVAAFLVITHLNRNLIGAIMRYLMLGALLFAGCAQTRPATFSRESELDSTLESSLQSSFSRRERQNSVSLEQLIGSVDVYVSTLDAQVGASERGRSLLYPSGHQILVDYRAAERQGLPLSSDEGRRVARALEFHAYSCTVDGFFEEAYDAYSCAISLAPNPVLYSKRAWISQYLGQAEAAVQDRLYAEDSWPALETVDLWREESHSREETRD